MASIRSLGFSIFSTYNGSGVTRARRDINDFSRDIDRNRQSLVTQAITLRALSRISLSALVSSAAAVAPAMIPITQAAMGAAGAFTAMSASAGSAAGIYGAAMKGAITSTLAAGESVKTLRGELAKKKTELAALKPGTAAYNAKLKEITETQKALNEAMKGLSPTQKSFIKATDDMTGAWNKFIVATQDKTLSSATDVVVGLTAAIPKLTSVVDAVHPSIKRATEALKEWLSGAGFERFISVIKNEGVPSLEALLNAGRHVLTFLGEGFRAFAPEGTKLAESIERGAAALAKWSQAGGFTRFIDKVQQNAPQVREFFRALGDALKNVKVAIEGLGMPALAFGTALLKIVAAMPPSWIQAFLVGWMALRAVMLGMAIVNGVSLAFAALGKAVAFCTLVFSKFMMTTIGIRLGLLAYAVGAKLAAAATFMLSGAFLASPIFWIVAAIAVLVAAIVLIATKTTWFQTAWKYTWNFIKEVFSAVWGFLTNGLGQLALLILGPVGALLILLNNWSTVWNAIKMVADMVWNALQTAWNATINALVVAWQAVSGALTVAWNAVWNAISLVVTTVWNALQIAWNAFVNGIILIWTTVSGALTAAWNAVWNAISLVATLIWNALQIAWNAFINGIITIWNAVSAALSAAWNAIWTAMQAVAQAIWAALQAAWNAFINGVITIWNTVSAALSATWNAIWTAMQAVAQAVWAALQAAWQAFITAVQTIWTVFSTAISAAWNLFWTTLQTVAQTIWTALQTAWNAFWTVISTIWNTFRTAISEAWSAFWNLIQDVAQAVWDAIKGAWQGFVDGVTEIWDTFSGAFEEAWEATWEAVKSIAKDIWNSIANTIEGAINGIISIVNGLISGFNSITDFLGIDVTIGEIGDVTMPKFADGGMVQFKYGGMTGGPEDLTSGGAISGYAPGRDRIPALLSRGEGVLTPEAVRGLGGPGFVNSANRTWAGHRGAGKGGTKWQGNRLDTGRDNHNMFAKGGIVGGMVPFAVGGMTADALRRAGVSLGMVSQGEYSNGRLSAGTHAGGGVVDISSTSPAIVSRLRAAGFAAWARTGPAWAGNEHIHAVLMNHPALSGPAAAQVASFRAGGDGLGVGGGGGGGFDIMGMIVDMVKDHVGKILLNTYRGLDALAGIGGAVASFFGGGDAPSDGGTKNRNEDGTVREKRDLGGTGGGGIIGNIGGTPESRKNPSKDNMGDAVKGAAGDVIGGILGTLGIGGQMMGMLGRVVLSLLSKGNISEGLADASGELGEFGMAGRFGEILVGMGKKATDDWIPEFLLNKKEEAGPLEPMIVGGGAGGDPASVANWSGLAAQALARAGLPAGQLTRFLSLMAAESGGNPNAINLWDSNAGMGQPSQGLMQVIPSTFAAYRDPSLPNNIVDPLANMTAAARYIKARYGGSVPGSPYAEGTDNATPGAHLVGEKGPELVTAPGYAMFGGGEQVLNAAETAAALAPPAPPVVATGGASSGGGSDDPLETMEQLMEAAQRMSEIVMTAWNEAISSGKTGQGALASVHQALVAEMATDVPGAYGIMRAAAATAWAAMNAQTTAAWTVMRDGVYAEAQLMQGTTMPLANQAMSLANGLAWQEMNAASLTEWGLMRDTTFTEANDFIAVKMPAWADEMDQAVSTSFEFMNEATAESWAGMQDATRAPVNWIITNAYNNGLARLWNEVAEVIFEDGARTLPTVATLAKGGPVNGPGTSTSDSIPARLSKGEHVWTAKEVRAAGGHRAVQAMRSDVVGHGVRGAHAGCGFAKGGWNAGSDSMSGGMSLPGLGELKRGFMMDEAEPFLDALDSGARGALESNNFKQMGAIADALSPSDWMRQYIEKDDELNRIGSGGPPWIPGVSDVRTSWGGVAVNQRTADMLNMAISLGASFSATQGSWSTGVSASAGTHAGGGVVDLVPASNGNVGALRAVGFAAWNRGAAWGSPSFGAHIHAVALGDPTVSGAAAAQIQSYLGGGNGLAGNGPDNFGGGIPSIDGVAAISGGGREVDPADLEQRVVAFDRGGWIMPGQFAYNGTGRPELATPADDIAKLAASVEGGNTGGECLHLEFNFNGPVSNEQDVRKAIDDAIPKLRRAIQAGSGKRTGG